MPIGFAPRYAIRTRTKVSPSSSNQTNSSRAIGGTMGIEQLVRMRFVLLETYDTGVPRVVTFTRARAPRVRAFERRRATNLRAHSMYRVHLRING